MKISQISLFLENSKGRLYKVMKVLGEAGVDIKALTVAENENFGVLRMVVDNPELALDTLKKEEFVANISEIVAVEVSDSPGGLAAILKIFNDEDINVEYLYAFVEKKVDKAIVVFRFDDSDRAIDVLKKNNINVLGQKDIKGF